ncbi:redoxin domain-containing protein [Demequina sp. SO4-13]|uniref:redoxin domain-containing protein n=1 Tax=Demequina sp. SO4-13 TaxID=3401027 RepID=UPI003AF4ECAB
MRGSFQWTAGIIAAGLTLAGCASADAEAPASGAMESGTPGATPSSSPSPSPSASEAPESPFAFEAQTVSGEMLDGETLRGRDVILWFWAPWCPTCMVEGKEHVSQAIAELPEGVEMVGIAGRSDDVAAMEEFLDWTGTGDVTHVMDMDGEIWEAFGVLQQPAFVFVNDDGTGTRAGSGLKAEDILERAEEMAAS